MKTLKTLAAAAATLVATASMTTAAHADSYRKCKDTEATIAGGVVGGSLGTIIGEEIAGRDNRTEGAVLGAIIGGIAGAAIGDSASSCEKDGRIYDRRRDGRWYPRSYPTSNSHYGRNTNRGYTTVRHPGRGHAHGHRNRHYDYNRGYGGSYGYNRRDAELRRLDNYIDQLRREREDLKRRAQFERYNPYVDRRLREIAFELDRAKRDRKRVKNADYYRDDYRRGHPRVIRSSHYHGSNICYSDH